MSEFRRIDHNAVEMGVSIDRLMDNAGKALAEAAMRLARRRAGAIVFLCGKGNNGGDGYSAARHVLGAGGQAVCVVVEDPTGPASRACRATLPADAVRTWRSWRRAPGPTAVLVDCLLGSGVQGPPRPPYAAVIRWINEQEAPVLACDIPSGMGTSLAVRPRRTVTFHARKEGMTRTNSGIIEIASIGIPRGAETDVGIGDLRAALKPLSTGSHKGDHGHVLVIGGGPFAGAPHYAGMAAYRTGADLVTIVAPPVPAAAISAWGPDCMVRAVGEGDQFTADDARDPALVAALRRGDAIVLGPGLGPATDFAGAVFDAAAKLDRPIVVDADGLDAITAERLRRHGRRTVLTPHAREFIDLGRRSASEAAVRSFAKAHDTTVLRKGAIDIIASGERRRRCRRGHPTMTVGGTGDALAGVVAALMATGADPLDAASAGAYLMGRAGETAAASWQRGARCMDIIDAIPAAFHDL